LQATATLSSLRLQRSSRVLTTTVASLDEPPKAVIGAPLLGFASLQHVPAPRVHLPQAKAIHPLRSACRVWLPSWRFTPLDAWSGLFHPDGVLGIPPTERSPPGRWDEVSLNAEPACRCHRELSPLRRSAPAGIAAADYRALALPRSPMVRRGCLARCALEAPLGFSLPGSCCRPPCRKAHAPDSPYALCRVPAKAGAGRRLRVSLSGRLARLKAPLASQRGQSRTTLLGFLCLLVPMGSGSVRGPGL
jgi:hypothetical protein